MARRRQKGIIPLQPVRHAAPTCGDYGSPDAVMAFERAMRAHRAHTEPFEVRPPTDGVDGAWQVASGSGGAYFVDILDGSGGSDACTCPDFIENQLGTCKHLEAVRRILLSRPGYARAFRALPRTPLLPALTVDAGDGLALKLLGPWTKALLRRHGLHLEPGQNRVEVREGRSLRAGNGEVRILHAVPMALDRQRALADGRARTEALRHAMDTGQVKVDLLKHPLFPYQLEGVAHLLSAGRALLADDMGCGKTVQAIAACEVLRARGEAKRVVVVTMASLKHQWAAEIDRYAGAKAVVVGGSGASRAEALASDAPYKVLSYELTWRELPRLQDLDADVLILDEAQRAKNFRTKTASTLRAIPSRFLFVLTGTPVENRLDDLYALLQLVDPRVLGPLWRFNLDFHQQNPKGRILGCKNLGELRQRIAKVVLRRRKEDVLSQLPPLTEQTRYTALSAAQRDLEQATAPKPPVSQPSPRGGPSPSSNKSSSRPPSSRPARPATPLNFAIPSWGSPPLPSWTSSRPWSRKSRPRAPARSSSFPNGRRCSSSPPPGWTAWASGGPCSRETCLPINARPCWTASAPTEPTRYCFPAMPGERASTSRWPAT